MAEPPYAHLVPSRVAQVLRATEPKLGLDLQRKSRRSWSGTQPTSAIFLALVEVLRTIREFRETEQGSLIQLRRRPWLVDALLGDGTELQTLRLSCIADDAQGERLEVLWDAEIGAAVLDEDGWRNVGQRLPDSPEVLAVHLRWRSATAADRDLLQAPFWAGIGLDALPASAAPQSVGLPLQTRKDSTRTALMISFTAAAFVITWFQAFLLLRGRS